MKKVAPLPLATMNAPIGWRITSEVALIEDVQRAVKTPLHPGLDAPQSPASVTMTRETVDPRGFQIERALNNFVGELADGMRGFEMLEEAPFPFADGTTGLSARIRFQLGPDMTCVQRHVVRIDASVVTRFCISLDARRSDQLNDLDELVRSFRPLTDKT